MSKIYEKEAKDLVFVALLMAIDPKEKESFDVVGYTQASHAVKSLTAVIANEMHNELCTCQYRKEAMLSEDGLLSPPKEEPTA
jgi:hypothetical protein